MTGLDADLEAWRASRRPDTPHRRRVIVPGLGMRVVRELARCQLCGARTLALDPHHIVPRSQGGDDVLGNIAPLCTFPPSDAPGLGCHARITENDPGALRAFRETLDELQVAYVLERKGAAWLEGRYPPAR